MRPILFRTAYAMMGVLTCAWPLGIYQHVPLTGLSVVSIVGATLVLLWSLDLAVYRTPRIPFELLWPTTIIVAVSLATRSEQAFEISGIAALFLATLHFARDRENIERWITWTAAACLIAAVADLLYRTGYGWPTAYAIPSHPAESPRLLDAASAMSGSLASGSTTLLVGTGLWAVIAYRARAYRAITILGFLIVATACALHIAGLLLHVPIHAADWISKPSTRWLIGGVAIWLLARIGAKNLVERERTPEGQYLFITSPVVAIVIVLCFSSFGAMAWHAWAAALAAGYVIRDKRAAPVVNSGRFGTYAAIALIPYAAMNAYYIDPGNTYDGRNYVQDLRADYASGELTRVVQRLNFWHQRTGHSPSQNYWAARVALDLDRPAAAAAWAVGLSRRSGTHGVPRPVPTKLEIDALLNRFRDFISALPEKERGLAYERALSACGDTKSAEASLRQRIAGSNPVYEEIGRAPLQHALEFLLSDIVTRMDFTDWSVAELIAVLDLSGARIEPAPEGIDRSWLPAAVTFRRDAYGIAALAETVASSRQMRGGAMIALNERPAEFAEAPWKTAALPFDASWQITLHSDDEGAAPILTVTIGENGDADLLLSDPLPGSAPDQSAVFIWLP